MKARDVEITVDWLRERCRIERDEDGREHWIWLRFVNKGNPRGHVKDGSVKGSTFSVRPAVYAMVHPQCKLGRKWTAVVKCDHEGCVHPDCVIRERRNAKRKGVRRPASVRAKISATKRAAYGSPTPEQVRLVRAMPGTAKAISQALGVKLNAVHDIRSNRGLHDFHDPFGALVAQLR